VLVKMKHPSVLNFFLICAVVDFVFGRIKWHSVAAGLVAIVCGLPLTALFFLFFRERGSSTDDSGAPRS
jgi:hypothetical protein